MRDGRGARSNPIWIRSPVAAPVEVFQRRTSPPDNRPKSAFVFSQTLEIKQMQEIKIFVDFRSARRMRDGRGARSNPRRGRGGRGLDGDPRGDWPVRAAKHDVAVVQGLNVSAR
jgi:hypothetical protein